MELTKEYFDQQLKNFATKADLNGLASKDELKALATKDDFKTLEGKVDGIKTTLDSVKAFIYKNLLTKAEQLTVAYGLTSKEQTNQLMNTVDTYIKETRTYHQEFKAVGQ